MHKKLKNKTDEKNDIQEKKIKLFKRDIAIATGTPEGIIFARHIMNLCGFFKSDVIINPETKEISKNATLYNCFRSNIWLEIRQVIPKKTRIKIENEKTEFNIEDL